MILILFVQGLYHKIRTTILGVVVSDKSNSNLSEAMEYARKRQMQDAKYNLMSWIWGWLCLIVAPIIIFVRHEEPPYVLLFLIFGYVALGNIVDLHRYLTFRNNPDYVEGLDYAESVFDHVERFWLYVGSYLQTRNEARMDTGYAYVSIAVIVSFAIGEHAGVHDAWQAVVFIASCIVALWCGTFAIKRWRELKERRQYYTYVKPTQT